jgi:hypothetical protein
VPHPISSKSAAPIVRWDAAALERVMSIVRLIDAGTASIPGDIVKLREACAVFGRTGAAAERRPVEDVDGEFDD